MSGVANIGSPRPRPLSGGFWTLLSWLRREDHFTSNESLSSAGSDRTAVSFAFLAPAHYHGSAPPVAVPPPGPPTDTYKQRVRERNLRRQYDRGITLHRKYGLFRGDGVGGYDASTLPPSRRAQGAQERERRATSECYNRRAAHVPGKRRAPPPPSHLNARCTSIEPTVSTNTRRTTRKRPAPQPPAKIVEKSKENIILNKNAPIFMNDQLNHDDIQLAGRDILTDCKSEKYIKKEIKDKTKPEKSFLKQIFENKKRNSFVDISTVKVLPSISELDAQAAEIIENNKLKNTEAISHQTILQAVKENYCTKCFKKPCICAAKVMSSNLEQRHDKNASTYTQTENALRANISIKNDKLDEKQKLKEMLKEMKDSLPKKSGVDNNKIKSVATCSNQNKDMPLMEAPTLRIGSKCETHVNNSSKQTSSSHLPQKTTKKTELCKIKKQDMGTNTAENKPTLISNDNLLITATPTPNNSSNGDGKKENNKIIAPLKISTLLNPIYIPKEIRCTQNVTNNIAGEEDTKVTKPGTSQNLQIGKIETADAVRNIVLNSALPRSQLSNQSQPLNAYKQESNNNVPNTGKSVELRSFKSQIADFPAASGKQNSNGERLSQHLRRRELVTKLEQSIAKGDEIAAAEAASKLAQLRLTCSVLSFTSHILSEPSTSKIQPDRNIPQDFITNIKSTTKLPSLATTHATPKLAAFKGSNDTSNQVSANEPTTSSHKVQEERQSTACVNTTESGTSGSNFSCQQASTSKGFPLGGNANARTIAIDVWVEDKEKARGPIKLMIKRAAAMRDLRRQAEQSLGLPTRLQRWIIGRTLCTDDNTPLVSLAGPALDAPFYLCLVESDTDQKLSNRTNKEINELQSKDIVKKPSDVYTELVKLERQALVPNAEVFECEICMEQCKSGDGAVLRECVHSFCKSCLADVIRHCEEPAVLCPATGCPGELHEREIRALVSQEEYERWLARGLAAAESGTRNAFHCRTRDCTGWALCEVGVRRFPCPVCKHTNCVPCQAIHENETCEQHRAKLLAAAVTNSGGEPDEGTRALIDSLISRGEALQCPECSAIITKKWGCDWVKCSACKTEICWVTRGRRWGPAGRGDTTGGCRCGVDGKRCHPSCGYCH